MSNLQLRIISAIVLGAIVLAVTWLGGWPFRVMAAMMAAIAFHEWTRMARRAEAPAPARDLVADILMLTFSAGLLLGIQPVPLLILAVASAILVGGWTAIRGEPQWPAAGLLYAALPALAMAQLRGDSPSGLKTILYLFAVVWATDILAYFVGRAIGGPKLAPSISPGKTRSGAVGGLVGALLFGLAAAWAGGAASLPLAAGIAIVLSAVSQAGDLLESWVKRRHGAKDSGTIIPGHGGVMDRVDGLVAAAFALYVLAWLFGGGADPAQLLFPA